MRVHTGAAAAPSPREVFEQVMRGWLAGRFDTADDLLADDAVVEVPFAPPGRPRRFAGREEFLAFARPARAALPVRFEESRDVVIHETADPATIVAEYELAGTVTTTNTRASASFVLVLRVRDGKIVHWREYQDIAALAAAMTTGLPQPD
jgi:ketosteroid isomerase-like protein